MTDVQERASVVYEQIYQGVLTNPLATTREILTPIIAAAMAQVEAETWERARIKLRRDCIHEHWMKPVKMRMIDCDRCILLCRQQAQRAKEGKG